MIRFFHTSNVRKAAEKPASAKLRFHVAPDVKASMHPDGMVLIHLGKGTVFSANRAGAAIWNAAAQRWSVERVAKAISGEFDIPADTAQRDTTAFLRELEAAGLLIADAS